MSVFPSHWQQPLESRCHASATHQEKESTGEEAAKVLAGPETEVTRRTGLHWNQQALALHPQSRIHMTKQLAAWCGIFWLPVTDEEWQTALCLEGCWL